jgi:hypothetical protein
MTSLNISQRWQPGRWSAGRTYRDFLQVATTSIADLEIRNFMNAEMQMKTERVHRERDRSQKLARFALPVREHIEHWTQERSGLWKEATNEARTSF